MTVRRVDYHWHLRRIMAAHNMWKTTELGPLLRDRGINLSSAQVYRLVTDKPERLPLRTLAALCDIFACTPADLIEPYVETGVRKAAGVTTASRRTTAVDQGSFRPRPARIVSDDSTSGT
jgi:DNA-binding Xre family transcriptional regulator